MLDTREIEEDKIKWTVRKFINFTSENHISDDLHRLLDLMIEFSSEKKLSTLEINQFKDIVLNTMERCVSWKKHLIDLNNSLKSEGKSLDKDLEETINKLGVIVPRTNDKKHKAYLLDGTTAREKKHILNMISKLGFLKIEKHIFKGINSKENRVTSVKLLNAQNTSEDLIKFMKKKTSREDFERLWLLYISLFTKKGLFIQLGKTDWNSLRLHCGKAYTEAQNKLSEAISQENNKPLVKGYVGKYDDRKNKKDSDIISINDKFHKIEDLNNQFNSSFLKSWLSYIQSYILATDLDDIKKLNSDEIDIRHGGRFSSNLTSMDKNLRKYAFGVMNYDSIDIPSAIFSSIYAKQFGELPSVRLYNAISDSVCKEKCLDKRLTEDNFKFVSGILAEKTKRATILAYNSNNKKQAVHTANNELNKTGIAITLKEELKKDFPNLNSREALKELNIIDKSSNKLNPIALQSYKVNKRNLKFLEINGDTEENRLFLLLLGNITVSAKALFRAVSKEFPSLRIYMYSMNWDFTQYMESEIMLNHILPFMKKNGLNPFFIYDEFLVPKKYKAKAEKLMNKALLLEASKLDAEYLKEIIPTNNVETFKHNFESIHSTLNRSYKNQELFKKAQSKYRHYIKHILPNDTKYSKNIYNDNFSIWSDEDLLQMNNLSNTKVKYFKNKILSYLNSNNSFKSYKFIISLYIYALETNTMLLKVEEIDFLKVIARNNSNKNTTFKIKDKTLVLLNKFKNNYKKYRFDNSKITNYNNNLEINNFDNTLTNHLVTYITRERTRGSTLEEDVG